MIQFLLNDNFIGELDSHEEGDFTPLGILFKKGDIFHVREDGGISHSHPLDFEKGYLHLMIRLLGNGCCMIEGAVTQEREYALEDFKDSDTGIRFQPFMLKYCPNYHKDYSGESLFERGFHFDGEITPTFISSGCICDKCNKGFRLQSFHCGFSQANYFYSGSSAQTLMTSEYTEGCPAVGVEEIDPASLKALEEKFPKASDGSSFSYMNPLRCPHCSTPYIDFGTDYKKRANERYANVFMGQTTVKYP